MKKYLLLLLIIFLTISCIVPIEAKTDEVISQELSQIFNSQITDEEYSMLKEYLETMDIDISGKTIIKIYPFYVAEYAHLDINDLLIEIEKFSSARDYVVVEDFLRIKYDKEGTLSVSNSQTRSAYSNFLQEIIDTDGMLEYQGETYKISDIHCFDDRFVQCGIVYYVTDGGVIVKYYNDSLKSVGIPFSAEDYSYYAGEFYKNLQNPKELPGFGRPVNLFDYLNKEHNLGLIDEQVEIPIVTDTSEIMTTEDGFTETSEEFSAETEVDSSIQSKETSKETLAQTADTVSFEMEHDTTQEADNNRKGAVVASVIVLLIIAAAIVFVLISKKRGLQ